MTTPQIYKLDLANLHLLENFSLSFLIEMLPTPTIVWLACVKDTFFFALCQRVFKTQKGEKMVILET